MLFRGLVFQLKMEPEFFSRHGHIQSFRDEVMPTNGCHNAVASEGYTKVLGKADIAGRK